MTFAEPSGVPDFELAYKGSVNRWECDENDHLNVRFYSRMVWESLLNSLAEWKVAEGWRVRIQHVRYLAEARMAPPVSGFVAKVSATVDTIDVLTELRHSFTGVVLAAYISRIESVQHGLGVTVPVPLPKHAGPRGLPMDDTPYSQLTLERARLHGFQIIAKGVIAQQECDARGELPPHAIMGRVSDGMPNLWAILQTAEEQSARANGFQGGAVLEYRKHFHTIPKSGDRYELVSGVRDVTEKLQYFTHLLYDARTGRCIMSAEAVGVVLDLVERRSVVISPERRERMLARRLKSLTS